MAAMCVFDEAQATTFAVQIEPHLIRELDRLMAERELYLRAGALSLCDKNEEIAQLEVENRILRARVVPPYSETNYMFRSYFNIVSSISDLLKEQYNLLGKIIQQFVEAGGSIDVIKADLEYDKTAMLNDFQMGRRPSIACCKTFQTSAAGKAIRQPSSAE